MYIFGNLQLAFSAHFKLENEAVQFVNLHRRRDIVVRITISDLIVYYFSFPSRLHILEVSSPVLCGTKIILVRSNSST